MNIIAMAQLPRLELAVTLHIVVFVTKKSLNPVVLIFLKILLKAWSKNDRVITHELPK